MHGYIKKFKVCGKGSGREQREQEMEYSRDLDLNRDSATLKL